MIIKWNAILLRNIFACRLWKNQWKSLGKSSLQYHPQFNDSSKRFLELEIKKLPSRPLRKNVLKTPPSPPRVTHLLFPSYMETKTAKCPPISQDMIIVPEIFDIIELAGLPWDRLNTRELGLSVPARLAEAINPSCLIFQITNINALPKAGTL